MACLSAYHDVVLQRHPAVHGRYGFDTGQNLEFLAPCCAINRDGASECILIGHFIVDIGLELCGGAMAAIFYLAKAFGCLKGLQLLSEFNAILRVDFS